jgi:hypothetical protein
LPEIWKRLRLYTARTQAICGETSKATISTTCRDGICQYHATHSRYLCLGTKTAHRSRASPNWCGFFTATKQGCRTRSCWIGLAFPSPRPLIHKDVYRQVKDAVATDASCGGARSKCPRCLQESMSTSMRLPGARFPECILGHQVSVSRRRIDYSYKAVRERMRLCVLLYVLAWTTRLV